MKSVILILIFCFSAPQLRAIENIFRVQILSITPVPDMPDEFRISLRQFEQPYSKRPLRQPRQILWHVRYAAAEFQHDAFLTRDEYLSSIALLQDCLAHADGRFRLALASGGFLRPPEKPGEWFSSTLSRGRRFSEEAASKDLVIYTYAKAP